MYNPETRDPRNGRVPLVTGTNSGLDENWALKTVREGNTTVECLS